MNRNTRGDTRQAAHEVLRRLARLRETQAAYAERAGIEPSTITRLIHGMRPTEGTLQRLVHSWADDADAVAVLCAHLRDEIARAQVGDDLVRVGPAAAAPHADAAIESALAELRRYAAQDATVRDLLLDLSTVLRAVNHAAARGHAIAADSTTEYRSKKR